MCNKTDTITKISQKKLTYLLVRFDSDAKRTKKSYCIVKNRISEYFSRRFQVQYTLNETSSR